jgi:hypothetical protein
MPSPSFVRNSNWSSKAPLPSAECIVSSRVSSGKVAGIASSQNAANFSKKGGPDLISAKSQILQKTSSRPDRTEDKRLGALFVHR